MTSKSLLIVGGTGFIGGPLVSILHRAGHRVTVYHRGRHEPDLPAGVHHVRDPGAAIPVLSFPPTLRSQTFDAVILVVPLGEADAQAAVDAFRGRAGWLVAVSSGDVYAAYGQVAGLEPVPATGARGGSIDEDAPLRSTLYPYGRVIPSPWGGELRDYEKILVEKVVLGAPDLPGTVLRLPVVYGPGDWQHRFAGWLRRMDDQRPAILLSESQAGWRWTHGFVDDVALAIALAATDPRAVGRTYNVGEPVTPTLIERIRALGLAARWDGELVVIPDDRLPVHLRYPVNHAVDLAVDTTRIRRELGFVEQVPEAEALRRTMAWERANPPPPETLKLDYAAEDGTLGSSDRPG